MVHMMLVNQAVAAEVQEVALLVQVLLTKVTVVVHKLEAVAVVLVRLVTQMEHDKVEMEYQFL